MSSVKMSRLQEDQGFDFRDLAKLHVWVTAMYITIPMIPYTAYVLHSVRASVVLFGLWLPLVFLTSTNRQRSLWVSALAQRKTEFFLLGFFIAIQVLYYLFANNSDKAYNYIVSFTCMFCLMIMDAYYSIIHPKYRQAVMFICITCLAIQAAVSIPYILTAGGFIARQFASGVSRVEIPEAQLLERLRHGVGDNTLYSSLPAVIFMAYVLAVKNKHIFKLLLYVSIIPLVFSIFISTFLAAVVLLCAGFGLFVVLLKGAMFKPKFIFAVALLGIVMFFFYTNYVADTALLDPVVNKIEKFTQNTGESGLSSESDVTGRTAKASISINTFTSNPLFGIGVPPWQSYDLIGEHMPWVDFLAHFGLLGSLPYFLFLLMLFRRNRKRYFSDKPYAYGNSLTYNRAMFVGFIIYIMGSFISSLIAIPSIAYLMLFMFTSMDYYRAPVKERRSVVATPLLAY